MQSCFHEWAIHECLPSKEISKRKYILDKSKRCYYQVVKASTIASTCFIVFLLIFPSITNAEKAMATHSSTLAWKIPWTEEPGGLPSMGPLRVGTTEPLHFHFSLSCIGEGKGNPLQCSCLENPRDSGPPFMGSR